jgi:hypothetical protein
VRKLTSYGRLQAEHGNPLPDIPADTNNPHEVFYTSAQYTVSGRQAVGKDVLWDMQADVRLLLPREGREAFPEA